MEEASNGKVEETTLKEVAETGDGRKEGAFEKGGEYSYKVEVQSVIGAPVVDGNSGEATETRREKEAKGSSSSSSSSDDEEEEDDEKEKKEEKIVPLVEEEESVAQSDAVSFEHVVVVEEAATEDSEKVDAAAAVEQKEETEAEIPYDETANGVVLTAGAEETAWVAVDESNVVVPAAAAAAVEERATEEPVSLAEEEVKEGDLMPATAGVAPKEHGEDSSPAQPPADTPAISEGDVSAEHTVVDEGEIPESTGSPPIISVSRRTTPPTSWGSCCGLFEVLRRSDR